MAITQSVVKTGVTGDMKYVVIDITGDASSYATGGVDVSAIANTFLPLAQYYGSDSFGNGTHYGLFDSSTQKVQFRLLSNALQVANGASTATTIRVRLVGL